MNIIKVKPNICMPVWWQLLLVMSWQCCLLYLKQRLLLCAYACTHSLAQICSISIHCWQSPIFKNNFNDVIKKHFTEWAPSATYCMTLVRLGVQRNWGTDCITLLSLFCIVHKEQFQEYLHQFYLTETLKYNLKTKTPRRK